MKKRGFTLIELLVVISIISLLSSVVLANVKSAKDEAENVRVINNIKQYLIALSSIKSDTGGSFSLSISMFPSSCFGYGLSVCGNRIYSKPLAVDAVLMSQIDRYLPGTPNPNMKPVLFTRFPGDNNAYGAIFHCGAASGVAPNRKCTSFDIQYFLIGSNSSCGISFATRYNTAAGNSVRCEIRSSNIP